MLEIMIKVMIRGMSLLVVMIILIIIPVLVYPNKKLMAAEHCRLYVLYKTSPVCVYFTENYHHFGLEVRHLL